VGDFIPRLTLVLASSEVNFNSGEVRASSKVNLVRASSEVNFISGEVRTSSEVNFQLIWPRQSLTKRLTKGVHRQSHTKWLTTLSLILVMLEPHEMVDGGRSWSEPRKVVDGLFIDFGHVRATRSGWQRAFIVRATRNGWRPFHWFWM